MAWVEDLVAVRYGAVEAGVHDYVGQELGMMVRKVDGILSGVTLISVYEIHLDEQTSQKKKNQKSWVGKARVQVQVTRQ